MDAWALNNMFAAMPQIDSDLGQAGDKEWDEMRRKRLQREAAGIESKAHPEKLRVRNALLASYGPEFIKKQLAEGERRRILGSAPGLTQRAAEGIRLAVQMQYFDTPQGARAWAHSFSRIWGEVQTLTKKE